MVQINAVNTKRFIPYGQMLQIFYLEVIEDSDDPFSHIIKRFFPCFHPNHSIPSRDGKVTRFGINLKDKMVYSNPDLKIT